MSDHILHWALKLKYLIITSVCVLLHACSSGGEEDSPSITLVKYIDGQVATSAPGAELNINRIVQWRYEIINNGEVTLNNVKLIDTTLKPTANEAVDICELTTLNVSETKICEFSHTTVEGQHQSNAKVSGESPDGVIVDATVDAYYTGIDPNILTSLPTASPTSGSAPLTVTFTPDANTGNAILTYEWDFEGDGTFDRSETVGRDQSFTYNTPGNYNATLRVTDNQNEQATGITASLMKRLLRLRLPIHTIPKALFKLSCV